MAAPNNLKCVTYTDAKSMNKSSYDDFMLGIEHNIIGCGNKSLQVNDTVVIMTDPKIKPRYFIVVQLVERLYDNEFWAKRGGEVWEHNFKYVPLTRAYMITKDMKTQMKDLAKSHGLNEKNLFNARFCSSKMWPLLKEMFTANLVERVEE